MLASITNLQFFFLSFVRLWSADTLQQAMSPNPHTNKFSSPHSSDDVKKYSKGSLHGEVQWFDCKVAKTFKVYFWRRKLKT
jgi:hypothetical protein